MAEVSYETELYRKMRYAVIGTKGRMFIPVELLMEWEKARLRVNPKATPQNLVKFESVKLYGGSSDGKRRFV